MNDILFFVSLVAGWIILNIWVLPWFGIQTCMSGACMSRACKVPQVVRPSHTTNKGVSEDATGCEERR